MVLNSKSFGFWLVVYTQLKCGIAFSSARDQLTDSSVAIKKIMKPFSTPVLSKRTYRELKLLKHITHENVSIFPPDLLVPMHV